MDALYLLYGVSGRASRARHFVVAVIVADVLYKTHNNSAAMDESPSSSASSISAELEALTSKRASLKDRLKKRREAMGSMMEMNATTVSTAATANKKKEEERQQQDKDKEARLMLSDAGDDDVAKKPKITAEEKKATAVEKTKVVKSTSESSSAASKESKTSSSSSSKNRSSSHDERDELMSLLSTQSAKEKEDKKQREEILELLNKPTAKERTLMDTFRSASGGGVREFCHHSTKRECMRANRSRRYCEKLHFRKILQQHTDENLGDCSFLNTCFNMDSCKYIHYEVDADDIRDDATQKILFFFLSKFQI
jgi:hypothetical protein